MAKGVKRVDNGETNPETEERKRLKALAHTKGLLSTAPAKDFNPLNPSKIVAKHHGTDILKKSQRKNRYLFSFSGLLAPVSGGKIGELTNLGSKNPTLYLDFPQGRMKLFGTIVYPSNRYLTLQFSKGGKNVICEDYFDTMIVFSDACWVGKKDENPQETRLPFPAELYENTGSEYDFQAGAGSTAVRNHKCSKAIGKSAKEECTNADVEALSPARDEKVNKSVEVTPIRQSGRTAGKRFKFTEVSSEDDSPPSSDEISGSDGGDKKIFWKLDYGRREYHLSEINSETKNKFQLPAPNILSPQTVSAFSSSSTNPAEEDKLHEGTSEKGLKVEEQLPDSVALDSSSKRSPQKSSGRLVQTTISTMLKKAGQSSSAKKKVSFDKKSGSRGARNKKKAEISDEGSDDIEEFSSASEDSDEDWAA